MQSLPLTHPEIHANLMKGGFSCQIGSKNTFGKIPMDQKIKETISKDTENSWWHKRILHQNKCCCKVLYHCK